MSFKFGGGAAQSPYVPPPPAPPPANPASFANADVQQAGLAKGQKPQLGFGSTIATSPTGVTTAGMTAGKALTGQ